MKRRNLSVLYRLKSTVFLWLSGILTFTMAQASAEVMINEVDADQTGTDSAEFIELYDGGTGSSDLSGLSLVLYNGSDDASYVAFDLDGFTTNADGYFVLCANAANTANCDLDVSPDTNLIQNGADAVALVAGDAVSYPNDTPISTVNLLDALVYDTNDNDDAGLLVLLNPGQPQINEGETGNKDTESNQRCDNGSGGLRNSDTYEQHAPTPGTANACGAVADVDIFINEVDVDQTSTDSAEFIELYDGGIGFSDLSGLSLVLYNGSDDASYLAFDLDGFTTNADGYFVLCANAANTANCDLDVSPDTNLIQNGADAVALVTGDAVNYPNDTPVSTDNLLDALVYDTNDDDDAGLLVLLNPGQPQVNEGESGNKDTESNQRCANGSGGLRNTDTYAQHTPTPGTSNTCSAEPNNDIVINEVDADQDGTDSAEFIELYDGGTGFSDLSGLSLVLYNGSDDASYVAFDLDGFTTNADGYFVLCANSANTANCDLDVSPDTNLIQNGADAVALVVGDAVNYPNDTPISTENLLDAIVYDTNDSDDAGLLVLLNPGQPQINEGETGNQTTESNQRCDNGSGGLRNTDTYEQHAPTPGAENACEGVVVGQFGLCTDPATFIHDVQGNGSSSPLEATSVVIEGVVYAAFQGADQLNGFYMQEEAADHDADSTTSEGIFVADSSNLVSVGDLVRVQGNVNESFGNTELNSVSQLAVCSTGAGVDSTLLTLPVVSMEEFEHLEGMLVSLSQPLTVNENYNLARYGEVLLSDGRTYQFTHSNLPDPAGYAAHLSDLSRNQIVLDDANSNQNPDPVVYPAPGLSASNTLRSGSVTSVTGALGYSFGSYRMYPTETVSFSDDNPRTATPENVGGNFTVTSINVLNYFTTIDDSGSICGPSGNMGCRGADSAIEFTRQRDKIINAISTIDADIVGLVEIENNTSAAIADLVSGLNAVMGPDTYAFVDTGTIGTDAIKVGFIYKPNTVMPLGAHAILDSSVDPLFIDTKNRPSLAQTFKTVTNEVFTVAVSHFKSKGSDCDDVGDSNLNDGQGNCAGTRANASTALINWLGSDPTASGDSDVLIIGDLNAYAMEDAITNITGNGYTNLVDAFAGSTAYSYIFSGEAGYLDHALANSSLTEKVVDVTEWHINADEPRALDYNTEFQSEAQQSGLYADDVYRMSDHDPVIIGFDFAAVLLHADLNNDGDINRLDINLFVRLVRSGEVLDMSYDYNGDSVVNFGDLRAMYRLCTSFRCAVN